MQKVAKRDFTTAFVVQLGGHGLLDEKQNDNGLLCIKACSLKGDSTAVVTL